MLTENDRQEIRATIEAGRKTGRWAKPGNREWETSRGLDVAHAEVGEDTITMVWEKNADGAWEIAHASDTDGPV